MILQEILAEEFKRFDDKPINVVETGSIRGTSDSSPIGDGYSTLFFAEYVKKHGGLLTTIDLRVATAAMVLKSHGCDENVVFCEGYSIEFLAPMVKTSYATFDVVFLDSANDPQLILHEYMIAKSLVRSSGIILIDDVRMEHHLEGESALAAKGDLVIPHLKERGVEYKLIERQGWASYKTGVLVINGSDVR